MTVLFFILIVISAFVLGFIILVQNPKGGGLSGSIAGISNQFMGVKQTTDVLEKGTWLFAGLIAALCLFSIIFFKGGSTVQPSDVLNKLNTGTTTTAPANTTQQAAPSVTLPDSTKK